MRMGPQLGSPVQLRGQELDLRPDRGLGTERYEDFEERVIDGRVVPPPEEAAELRERAVAGHSREVDGDLPRIRDRRAARPAEDQLGGDPKVTGRQLDDLFQPHPGAPAPDLAFEN